MEHYEKFAHKYGFNNYGEMTKNSLTVIFDYGVSWMATYTRFGWLAWVDKLPDIPLKTFQTYEEAIRYINEVFEATEVNFKELIETCIVQHDNKLIVLN